MSAQNQCVAPRSKIAHSERCPHPARTGSEWCGRHVKGGARFLAPAMLSPTLEETSPPPSPEILAARKIHRVWQRWLARRAGPLLPFKEESNNPADFFSGDPVQEIPLRYFVSFVDADRKGYIMDTRSIDALFAHNTAPTNPFNRAGFPAIFLNRLRLHQHHKQRSPTTAAQPSTALTQEQLLSLEITDTFRHLEDIGYYTDPTWFQDLHRFNLQRFYIELADIWFHRALLTHTDRQRIVPTGPGMPLPVRTVLVMSHKALRHTVIRACKALITSASARADRQLGAMYVLGALTLVSPGAATAYPWLLETFSPGATRLYQHLETGEFQLRISHPAVLEY